MLIIIIFKDNTNNFRMELYNLHAEMNGTGFSLAYLFLENNRRYEKGICTMIIQSFFTKLRNMGLYLEFIFTDKDFA